MRRRAARLIPVLLLFVPIVRADGPADNIPANVRRIPALGVEVPADDRKELEAGLDALVASITDLVERAKKDARTADLLPDVLIYQKAVHDALAYREFFNARDIPKAKTLLKEGRARASSLAEGQAPWTSQTGLVVRGYVSKIDGSVQPYGLVVPPSYTDKTAGKYRLDFWFHGRGETLSEVNFLDERRTRVGEFAPPDTIVLHPYGRYCNAAKFAGEIDALEALDSVKRRYRVDDDRIGVRGFSMGGASVWQFATHYTDLFFAANPGAGFSETPRFLNVFQRETLAPTWYEQKLWNLYDCDKYAANLLNLPTVAYSGELDNQKQAADVMAEALKKEGLELTHVIGPQTKHQYERKAKAVVEKKMESLAARGRLPIHAFATYLVTYTLRYNRMTWLTIDALDEHWTEARVDTVSGGAPAFLSLKTRNVAALSIDIPAHFRLNHPSPSDTNYTIRVDDQVLAGAAKSTDGSLTFHAIKRAGRWSVGSPPAGILAKRHGLQGPIDDAFMDAFVVVRPTGKARSEKFAAWQKAEMDRAIEHWRRHFRGDARVKDDTAIIDADIASNNLITLG